VKISQAEGDGIWKSGNQEKKQKADPAGAGETMPWAEVAEGSSGGWLVGEPEVGGIIRNSRL